MNRRQQNRALKDWNELKRLVQVLDPLVAPVLSRGTFDSGMRQDVRESDLAKELQGKAISYSDRTGEAAIAVETADRVAVAIERMASNLLLAANIAKWVISGVPETTDEALLRDIPNCLACDLPVFGRVKAGYHAECYAKKQRLGIADRAAFRRYVQDEMKSEEFIENAVML